MENQMKEQVIYPKDLLFAALYRWRIAILLGLVLAIVLGGMQLLKGQKNGDAAAFAAYEQAMDAYETEKSSLQQAAAYWGKELENHQTYLRQSVLISLDPYAHHRGTLQFYITTDLQLQPEAQATLLGAYQAKLNEDAVIEALAQEADLSWQQFREIYSAAADINGGTLTLQVRHNDPDQIYVILNVIQKQIEKISKELLLNVGQHELIELTDSITLVADMNLADTVHRNLEKTTYLTGKLEETVAHLEELVPPVEPGAGMSVASKAAVFAVLGFAAGIFAVAVCTWFMHMESDKLYSARLLGLRTGIKILGTLGVTAFGPVGRCLRKWEGRDSATPAEKAALLAYDIGNRFPAGTLLLTGTGDASQRKVLADALTAAGICTTDCGSILHSSEAVEALKKADGVLLVEKCKEATCSEIFSEAQLIEDYGKCLLGCVVLDG